MNALIYLVLGTLDILCILTLIFVLFSQPWKEYLKENILISLLSAAASYLIRIVLDVGGGIDTLVQTIIIILMLRLLVRFKLSAALAIAAPGICAFIFMQPAVASLLIALKIVTHSDLTEAASTGVRIIQFSNSVIIFLICLAIHYLKIGLSFSIRPPHNFYVEDPLNKNIMLLLLVTSLSLAGCSALFFFLFSNRYLLIPPIALLLFGILITMVWRRDYDSYLQGGSSKNRL